MRFHLRVFSVVLLTSLVGGTFDSAQAAPAWVESESGCKVESLNPKPKESFAWTGRCVDGYAQGPGVLSWAVDGKPAWTFHGVMKAGRQEGEGRLDLANGDVYQGSFADGRRTGQGSYTFGDSRYVGGFVDGAFSGQGRFVTGKGLEYQGELLNGRWDGQGVMRWGTGEILRGRWKQGIAESGEISRRNGDTCNGTFQRSQLSGAGRCAWANGDSYEGGFLAGSLDGEGDYKFQDGRRYQGNFRRGSPDGMGALSRSGVLVYRGLFESGAPSSIDGLAVADGPNPQGVEAAALLSGLKFGYAQPVPLPLAPISGQKVCTKMGQPVMPQIQSAWRGEVLFEVVVRTLNGTVVGTETKVLTPGVDRAVVRALVGSIETTLRDTYECPGNHVFAIQFAFRV